MSTANIWWRITWQGPLGLPTCALVKSWGDALQLQASTHGTIERVNLDTENE